MVNQISDESLFILSEKTKETAIKIIEEKQIIEILSEFGDPIIVGSFELNLMIDEDIDIIVKTEFQKLSAANALNEFINKEIACKYEFGDFVKYPRKNRPKGYIVNLRFVYNHKNWEIEIWFLEDNKSYLQTLQDYKSKLDSKNRMIILREKFQRKMLGKTKYEQSSIEIYDRILN